MRKIVIASDSFKGSLSSLEVAEAASTGIHACMPGCDVVKVAVADGGEGTVDAVVAAMHGAHRTVMAADPLGRSIKAYYGIINDGDTRMAIIEMAAASGLPLLKKEERNPWLTSTFGTGQMIRDALTQGCRKMLIGIGGSATNDGGMGMMRALGVRFLDDNGNELAGCGSDLCHVSEIDTSQMMPEARETVFIIACDVDTPFCGPHGAAPVFAPQKGADSELVEKLNEGMSSFAKIIASTTGVDIANLPGSGAAGGLGGAFKAFLNGQLTSGADMVLDAIRFDELIEGADLVITGEGRIDYQSVKGKTPIGALRHARSKGIPVIAICGTVVPCHELDDADFSAIHPVTPMGMSMEEAMRKEVAAQNVRMTMERIMKDIG